MNARHILVIQCATQLVWILSEINLNQSLKWSKIIIITSRLELREPKLPVSNNYPLCYFDKIPFNQR